MHDSVRLNGERSIFLPACIERHRTHQGLVSRGVDWNLCQFLQALHPCVNHRMYSGANESQFTGGFCPVAKPARLEGLHRNYAVGKPCDSYP